MRFVEKYTSSRYEVANGEIIKADAADLLPFMLTLDSSEYRYCALVQEYLEKLEIANVPFNAAIRDRFKSKMISIMEVMLDDWDGKTARSLSYEEYKEVKQARIKSFFAGYSLEDYDSLFTFISEVYSAARNEHTRYQIEEGLSEVLIALAVERPPLYVEVLKTFVARELPMRLHPFSFVEKLVKIIGQDETLQLLDTVVTQKHRWLFGFFECLDPSQIRSSYLHRILFLYETAPLVELPNGWNYLLKYRTFDTAIFVQVARIVLARNEQDAGFAIALDLLFNPHAEANKIIVDLFLNELPLLKQAYFVHLKSTQYGDHDGQTLSMILAADSHFMVEYIDWMYSQKPWLSRYDDSHDYAFLWTRPDYDVILEGMVDCIYKHEKESTSHYGSFLMVFFTARNEAKEKDTIQRRQEQFLERLIEKRHLDSEFMFFLFNAIVQFPRELHKRFLAFFVKFDRDFEHFKNIPLEPGTWSASGSLVPVLQDEVGYLESLLPIFNTSELLQHRHLIEKRIGDLRQWIAHERTRDFLDD